METRDLKPLKAATLSLMASVACLLAAASHAQAGVNFQFDQTGTGTPGTFISGFNESAGNGLAYGGNQAVTLGPGATFQQYFQTSIASLVGTDGNPVPLSTPLTVVASITEEVTLVSGNGTTAYFTAAPNQAPGSGLAIYAGGSPNNLMGTGFINGSPILTASLIVPPFTLGQSTLNSFTVTTFPSGSNPIPFDQSPTPASQYSGTQSVMGAGNSTLDFLITSHSSAYFPTGGPAILGLELRNAGANTPFTLVNPSLSFSAGTGTVTPSLGPVNGVPYSAALNNPDFQFQTSGNISVVPEPASVVLTGLGLVGVVALVRSSRNRND